MWSLKLVWVECKLFYLRKQCQELDLNVENLNVVPLRPHHFKGHLILHLKVIFWTQVWWTGKSINSASVGIFHQKQELHNGWYCRQTKLVFNWLAKRTYTLHGCSTVGSLLLVLSCDWQDVNPSRGLCVQWWKARLKLPAEMSSYHFSSVFSTISSLGGCYIW